MIRIMNLACEEFSQGEQADQSNRGKTRRKRRHMLNRSPSGTAADEANETDEAGRSE
jgi:hypothetical protein